MLVHAGILRAPLLYLSLFLKQNRARYYELLDVVRREGDWEARLEFFLDGVRESAEGAASTALRLDALFRVDRDRIAPVGRRAGSALRAHDALKHRPLTTVHQVRRHTGLSFPAAGSALELLVELGIAREITGKRRNRVFAYDQYLSTLSEGTEPLPVGGGGASP
jgi:Fic family protein